MNGILMEPEVEGMKQPDEDHVSGLEAILNYLHDAGGFSIAIKPNVPLDRVLDRQFATPQNEEQALSELHQAAAEIGCTVVRRGQLLTILTPQQAKKHPLPLPLLPPLDTFGHRPR